MKIKVALWLVFLTSLVLRADDWTTSDGKTFHSVKVLSHDDGYVTIIDSDGGGRVPLRTLTPELRKQFGYDAAKAAASEAATAAQDKKDREAIASTPRTALNSQVSATAPTGPASAPAPTVEATIHDDKEKLASLDKEVEDIATRPTGQLEIHRLEEIRVQRSKLQAEIDGLGKGDAAVAPATAPPPSAPAVPSTVNVADNERIIREDKEKLGIVTSNDGRGSISDTILVKRADLSPADEKLQADLQAEIDRLEKEDDAALALQKHAEEQSRVAATSAPTDPNPASPIPGSNPASTPNELVDIAADQAKIEQDKAQIASLNSDLRVAQHEVAQENQVTTGADGRTSRTSLSGGHAAKEVTALDQQIAALQLEITTLQERDDNSAAAKAHLAPNAPQAISP